MPTVPLTLPIWAQWLQAIGPATASIVTAFVAIAVWVVAYRQWRTAREKLVLDLFARRFELYVRAKDGVDQVVRDGDARKNDGIQTIARVRVEGEFLFGDDVLNYLARLQKSMAKLQLANTMYANHDASQDWPQITLDESLFVTAFYEDFPKIAAPYMRMTHKL
ncbi:hypothetical protein [Mesorhizobium sp.]|uniref:hypothetical protein n=1 Tax=Mesorhizobium sp. TaxID=1871066 RepID=UPI000FE9524D|nr:hypothetical protein [Mesorhizobium sp.]RWO76266.1 MAG: hypothetical protein EOQ96_33255 [Mesorhizobium sp.]